MQFLIIVVKNYEHIPRANDIIFLIKWYSVDLKDKTTLCLV